MAITKEKKEKLFKEYIENLKKSSAIFLTKSQGIPVNELTELRRKLREVNSGYVVVKNTLTKKALNEVGLGGKGIEAFFEGPIGVSFCYGDPPPVAKALIDYAKNRDLFEIKGGLLGETFLNADDVKSLAELPPLEVIRAQLLGILSAPASQLAGVLASGVRQVVNVLDAYTKSAESDAA